jgi:hypothetical protein
VSEEAATIPHKDTLAVAMGRRDGVPTSNDAARRLPGDAPVGTHLPERTICGQLNTMFNDRDLSGRPTCTRNLCPSLVTA